MQFRDHPGVQGKRDAYPFDPRLLKIETGYNPRDLDAADERDDLDELKESIRSNGVRVPLEVRLIDDEVFIVAGHRRHKAVMELISEGEEIKAVPVMPEPKHTSEVDRVLNLVISNSGKPLKPLEIAEVVRRLNAFGWDKGQIAKRLGWRSAASVTQHLEMLALPEAVKEHVRNNDVSATTARTVVRNLPKGTDPKLAADIIAANKEENRKLGVGKRNTNTKVTKRTLARNAKPKSDSATADAARREPTHEGADHSALSASSEKVETVAPEIEERVSVSETDGSGVGACGVDDNNGNVAVAFVEAFDAATIAQSERVAALPRVPPEIARALLALRTFALIAEEQCVGERDDSEKIEASAIAYKQAWESYRAIAGEVL